MPRRNRQRKPGTTHRSPRPKGTARMSRISRCTAKSRHAGEWGGWGRISVDGPGQNNPDRSEGPWGRAVKTLKWRCTTELLPRRRAGNEEGDGVHEGRKQTAGAEHSRRKAPTETPALKPYWGKPAVRNFRGDDGDVGIIRSPVRAIVLPDRPCHLHQSRLGKPENNPGLRVMRPPP